MTLLHPKTDAAGQRSPRAGRSALSSLPALSGRSLLGLLLPLLLLAGWQLAASAGIYSTAQLPPPSEVLSALTELIRRGELWHHLAISTQRVLIGFTAGSVLGLALGGLVGLSRTASAALSPTIQAIRAVPSLAWVPLLLLWLGIGETPKIVLVAIGAFFPVYTTVSAALAHIDPHLIEVGRAYGRSGLPLLSTILFPAATPAILSGLRLGLAQGWLFLVAAELIASSMGLGFLLIDSQNTGRTDIMLLAIILLALLGKLSDTILGQAENRLLAHRR
ncbi:sulfonate transport system permease protein [Actinoplanes lutulentus]|uniref:Sulfonate transport system permease protein n=1 Tax=Actinoplanes lutulentus TaxID=1287878 RepID=A0A327ZKN5_9ACTN|nr:ABC transporter permease [Actinoplanes lutulentus]MBB2944201.1 sulfonate transport system permease protein [Actinoplanes lutulentus]RAK42566.1 sulfonate transport system permease protein [Actinoplanes lutulentus]